jgi:uncharacterized protein YodC (DUF2158 family)
MAFKVGDIVRLKSGGPKMTVTKVVGDRIHCEWFNDDNKVDFKVFPPEALEAVTD